MALLDQFGREIPSSTRPEGRQIAVAAVRDRWSTYPSAGLTPHRLATIFREADQGDAYRQAELFEEMEEKDPHLFSTLGIRKNAVLRLDYDVTPYSESAEDRKIRDFVADALFNLPDFEEALLDLLDALGKGYSLVEILWGIDGDRAVVTGLNWIHPKKASFLDRGAGMWTPIPRAPRILTEEHPIDGEEMPPFKLAYHRYKARSGHDTRAGILRVCAWMYLFKNYAVKDWSVFAETFGMPLRVGKYDAGASQADKDALLAAIRSLGTDAAGIISKNTEIQFVEAVQKGGAKIIHEALAEFANKEMSKAVLGQTATTEGTPGKLGNENAQDEVRHDLIEADAEALSRTIRFHIIRPLVGFNFGWDKPLPWFKLDYQEPEDLEKLAKVYESVVKMGFEPAQEHVSEKFKIPMLKKGETPLRPSPGGVSRLAARDGLTTATKALILSDRLRGRGRFTPEQEALERLSDAVIPEAAGRLLENERRIVEAVRSASSYEEALQNVLDLYPDTNLDDLAALMEAAALNADLFGRYTAGGEGA